jgi:predicted metal-dependent peptidase
MPDDDMPDDDMTPDWGAVMQTTADDGQPLSEAEAKQIEAEMDIKVLMAADAAKAQGKLPAKIDQLVQVMRRCQIDWRDVLNRFIGGDQPDDYTWRRPQKNAWFNQGIYLPSVDKLGAGDVIILGDSSASVTDAEWSHFLGEMNAITDDHKPRSVTVITFDTKVQTVKRYEQGEVIEKVALAGRGGTRITPAFDYVEEHQLPCDNMVVLTDLEISDFPDAPEYPVLWVSTDIGSDKAPFGEVAILKMGD